MAVKEELMRVKRVAEEEKIQSRKGIHQLEGMLIDVNTEIKSREMHTASIEKKLKIYEGRIAER